MEIALLSLDGVVDAIRRRLMADWIIVGGDSDSIRALEECVYTPGTANNADFEAVGFLPTVYLARKTERLRRLLKDPPDFNDILVLTFGGVSDGSTDVVIDSYDHKVLTKEVAVNRLVARVRGFMESSRRGIRRP